MNQLKVLTFIKHKSLNPRLFEQLCKVLDREHHQPLLQICWPSGDNVCVIFWTERQDKIIHHGEAISPQWSFDRYFLVSQFCISVKYLHQFKYAQLKSWRRKSYFFKLKKRLKAVIKKFELWHHRLSDHNHETFPNLTDFLGSTDEEFSGEDITYHMTFGRFAT